MFLIEEIWDILSYVVIRKFDSIKAARPFKC